MTNYSIDLHFAWAKLGLAPGAAREEVDVALARSRSLTRNEIRLFADFFRAREKLAGLHADYAFIRQAYRRRAFKLHPDRVGANAKAEEELKELNAALDAINRVYRRAKDHYGKQGVDPPPDSPRAPSRDEHSPKTEKPKPNAEKYFATAIPRTVRLSRLGYLPTAKIIGTRVTPKENDLNLLFDVVMLTVEELTCAKARLVAPHLPGIALNPWKFNPPYVMRNVKEYIPAPGPNGEAAARAYFKKEFGL